jgi:uncharacterized protein YbbC (DUF1343 family)
MTNVLTGLDVAERNGFAALKNKKTGLVTNHTSLNRKWEWLPDMLKKKGRAPVRIFSPEHGLYGVAREGEEVEGYYDSVLGCQIVSLYGRKRKLMKEDISDLDAVVYDMQDAGVRFYTYISTLKGAVNACVEEDRELYVLDRPDPLTGRTVRGPLIEESLLSFVGTDVLPLQYGMTPGELAAFWAKGRDNVKIVKMKNWKRRMWFDETGLPNTGPSPNLPVIDSMLLYPGIAILEGVNVSIGRGTTRPFRLVGAPWIDGHALLRSVAGFRGIRARYVRFRPYYSKYEGEVCEGVELLITDRNAADPVKLAIHILRFLSQLDETVWTENGSRLWAEYITGVPQIDRIIEKENPDALIERWNRDAKLFRRKAGRYLIYS